MRRGGRHDNLVSSLCDPPFEKCWLSPCFLHYPLDENTKRKLESQVNFIAHLKKSGGS